MIDYQKTLKLAEVDYKDYCEKLVSKLNRDIELAGTYNKEEAYFQAAKLFQDDLTRVTMMKSITSMYFVRLNPDPIIINCI